MLALYALLAAWLLYRIVRAALISRTKVPGPWYSCFTSIVQKYYEFTRRRRVWVHSLHETYGPVVRLSPNEVSFANLEGMKEIYQSGGSGYDKTEFYSLFKQYSQRPMFSLLDRREHSQRKKLFADVYAMTNVLRPEMSDGIKERAASVVEKCKASVGSYLDVYITLHCYAVDCASHFLFNPGGSNTLDDPEELKLMQELSYHDSLKRRLIAYYWPSLDKLAWVFQHKSTSLSKAFVLNQVQSATSGEKSLIHRLKAKCSTLAPIHMAAECMDHLSAGIDTTGDGLCFLMYELSLPRSAAIQKRLQDEIVHNPQAKLDELPYLDAVVKEGLRLFPPIPMSLPRYVPENGKNICGYDLPGRTIVSCQAYSLHLLNEDVFPNPDKFIPERWLESEGELERNRLYFAFASGGRGCIGKNLALVEMKTLLREIYGRFTTRVAREMTANMSMDDQIIASRPRDQSCLLEFEIREQQF